MCFASKKMGILMGNDNGQKKGRNVVNQDLLGMSELRSEGVKMLRVENVFNGPYFGQFRTIVDSFSLGKGSRRGV